MINYPVMFFYDSFLYLFFILFPNITGTVENRCNNLIFFNGNSPIVIVIMNSYTPIRVLFII